MSDSSHDCIAAVPDISGVGVRIAIYVQNLFSFLPMLSILYDRYVSLDELKSIEIQSTTILTMAFAILLSTIIQALTNGLTNFHAAIILDLSWMNNTNTFIWFLLYIHHRSKTRSIPPRWSAWFHHFLHVFWDRPDVEDSESQSPKSLEGPTGRPAGRWRTFLKRLSRNLVLILGSLHLTLMAAVGIFLWSNPATFGSSVPCDVAIMIFGKSVFLTSESLRIWSLFIYALLLLPGINLALPIAFFLAPYLLYNKRRQDSASTFPIIVGLVVLGVINVIFIIDIERTIQRNEHLQIAGESKWEYGQILSLLLLATPLRNVLDAIAFDDLRTARRKREEEQQKYLTFAFQRAIREGAVETAREFVEQGVDVNACVQENGAECRTALQLASLQGDVALVKLLLAYGADVNAVGGQWGTALQAASYAGSVPVVKMLLGGGADISVAGGPYGTPLCAAAYNGKADVVKVLLSKGGGNLTPGGVDSAAEVAERRGHNNVAKLLRGRSESQSLSHKIKGRTGSAITSITRWSA